MKGATYHEYGVYFAVVRLPSGHEVYLGRYRSRSAYRRSVKETEKARQQR